MKEDIHTSRHGGPVNVSKVQDLSSRNPLARVFCPMAALARLLQPVLVCGIYFGGNCPTLPPSKNNGPSLSCCINSANEKPIGVNSK